jgi:hypothetical protein
MNILNGYLPSWGRRLRFFEQIHMPARALKAHNIALDFVDQQPIWLNVGVSKSFLTAFQRMVKIDGWQRRTFYEQTQ